VIADCTADNCILQIAAAFCRGPLRKDVWPILYGLVFERSKDRFSFGRARLRAAPYSAAKFARL